MKKIMFDDNLRLTEAVLKGRKTMTRRIITDPEDNERIAQEFIRAKESCASRTETAIRLGKEYGKYKTGETVAVARRYYDIFEHLEGEKKNDFLEKVCRRYKTSTPHTDVAAWYNKMFVSADLMIDFIDICEVWVERIQEIGFYECIWEGVQELVVPDGTNMYIAGGITISDDVRQRFKKGKIGIPSRLAFQNPIYAFAAIINKTGKKIGGVPAWDANPYCCAYKFKLVK